MKTIFDYAFTATISLLFAYLLIPVSRKLAHKIGLLDKPSGRKVHQKPTPLTGGIVIAISTFLAMSINPESLGFVKENAVLLGAALMILVIGILDDKMDVKPMYRLLVQIACAYAVASSGIRITGFYGVLGIGTLPLAFQYGLTIIVITGVVNAFNLMDGIDGLASGLALTGFLVLTVLSWHLGKFGFTAFFIAMAGSLVGFLRHNLSQKKVFLGDGGSLMLGFLLVSSGIYLLEAAQQHQEFSGSLALLIVTGIFLLPVLDSLRVYRGRIKKGNSPFMADRSHIHHLFLMLGFTHKKSSMAINLLNMLILLTLMMFYSAFSVTMVLVMAVVLFLIVAGVLTLNSQVMNWSAKIREMEEE